MNRPYHKSKRPNPISRFTRHFREFLQLQQASGYLLLIATVFALVSSNSGFGETFQHFWHQSINFQTISFTVEQFVNDGLMTIFFIVVGIEIKREMSEGALSTKEQAILPVAGAIGGMLFPAIIFLFFNKGTENAAGWAIPTATDIAFSLAVIQLLGNRVPLSLKVFLTALAVVDDLGAILIIALFYNSSFHGFYLILAVWAATILLILNKRNVTNIYVYLVAGVFLWYFLLMGGIHPTISGVILALFVPIKITSKSIHSIKEIPPSEKMLHLLSGFSGFVVMPLFALCNAGIKLNPEAFHNFLSPLSIGIFFALLVGKSVGITITAMATSAVGITKMPEDVPLLNFFLVNILAGIGFTMSIFVTNLAFTNPELIDTAKLAVIITSFTAGLLGYFLLRIRSGPR